MAPIVSYCSYEPLYLYKYRCWCLLTGVLLTVVVVELIFTYNTHIVKYHMRHNTTSNSARNKLAMTVDVSFRTAIAKKLFHVLPRAAFFDKRHRGRHKNTVVVLAHLIKTGLKPNMVIACIVSGNFIQAPEIKSLKINRWLHQRHPECTHDDVLIFCYDAPAFNNNKVSIVYVNPENVTELIAVESEHPLFVPNETNSHSSVMACTTVFDTPPHFGAWIRYQKTLGVDMVHINAQESFLNSNSSKDAFFLESLRNGFVQLKVWKEHLPGATHYHSQALYYQNCLYRYLGVHEYCICGDTDDFLTPTNGIDLDVHDILKRVFNQSSRPQVGSANLYWIRYIEPREGSESEIKDGNLTRYINTSSLEVEGAGYMSKPMYRLSAMIEFGIHNSKEYVSRGFRQLITPRKLAYVAHIKKTHTHDYS